MKKNRVLKILAAFCLASFMSVVSTSVLFTMGSSGSTRLTMIVPYSAGGGTDATTRALANIVKKDTGSQVTVENRTGGGGAVGMLYGANARSDGSVVTTITVELVTLPHTGTGGSLKPDQFKPIMMYNADYSVITVPKDSPWNNLQDFIKAAQDQKIQIGNSGVGAIWHLAAAALEMKAGVEFRHIPFEGAAPALTSLLGGHIDAVSVSYGEVAPQVEAGNLKVISVLAPERLASLPNVPTAKEAGYDVTIGTWRGLGVPASTPDEKVEELYTIFSKAANSSEFLSFMQNNNFTVSLLNSQEFAKRIAAEDQLFSKLIPSLGLAN